MTGIFRENISVAMLEGEERMKSIKTKITALMLAVMLVFTGCMQEEVNVVIKPDGSGSLTVNVTVDKAEYEKYLKEELKLSTSEIAEYEKKMESSGYKKVTVDGKECYTMTTTENVLAGKMTQEFADLDPNAYVTADIFRVKMNIKQLLGEDMEGLFGTNQQIDYSKFKFTVAVTFSKKILITNGTVDSKNPNKVVFQVPLDRTSIMFATTKTGVTNETIDAAVKAANTIKAPKIKKLKANKVSKKSKKATVSLTFAKVKSAKSYDVQWSLKKNFKKKAGSVMIKKAKYTIKKLKKGKKYYVRVRASKDNLAGVPVYSKWTKKTVKTKK